MDDMEKVKELRDKNKELLQALAREGVGEIPLGQARLEMLIEAVLPWDDGNNTARVAMELKWETYAHDLLTELVDQVRRAKLLQGVNLSPAPRNGQ